MRLDQKSGFTLIELLVVIAIIALLLAVIMPSLTKCKEAAKTVVCASQLRQFGVAWSQYSEENDGWNIAASESNEERDSGGMWFYRLGPYISAHHSYTQGDPDADSRSGVVKLLNCPSAKEWTADSEYYRDNLDNYGSAKMAWRWRGADQVRDLQGSYCMNAWMLQRVKNGHTDTSDPRYYPKFINAAGNVPLISDGAWLNAWPLSSEAALIETDLIDTLGSGYDGTYRMPGDRSSARIVLSRHGDAINIVFRDTHVEKIDLESLWSFPWHKDFQRVYDLKLPR